MTFPEPLDSLSSDDLAVLQRCLSEQRFDPGECLFRAGEPGDSFYIIDAGTVRVQLDREELDSEGTLGFVDAGSILGELAMLDHRPRSASAIADSPVHTRRLDQAALERLSQEHPGVALAVYQALGRNAASTVRSSNERLAAAVFRYKDPDVDAMVARARTAQATFATWSEKQVDALLLALARRVATEARTLAEATVECTRIGNVDDKTGKIGVASLAVLKTLFGEPGSGWLDGGGPDTGVREIASPVGVVFGLVPVTSPVATGIFKILIALKGRNAIILSPNRIAQPVCAALARSVDDVLQAEGAPADVVQWVTKRNSRRKTQLFMSHAGVDLVLATGGRAMVEAAYSSGNPALGVGPGNAPVLVADDADVDTCADNVIRSKSFDNGLICGAENNLVVVAARREELVAALERHGAAVLSAEETAKALAGPLANGRTRMSSELIGRSAADIAAKLGIRRERTIRLVVAPSESCAPDNPLAHEKMAPLVSLFTVPDIDAGLALCKQLMQLDGTGHTAVLYTRDEALAERFGNEVAASRMLLNTPATHGIVGATTGLLPSFTLGCGTFGGNSLTDNVGYRHLLNVKRLARHDPEREAVFDYMNYVNPSAALTSQVLGFDSLEVEAEGCIVRDNRGREFLDCLAGVGVMNVGHRHPRVVAAVREQLERMPMSSRLLFNARAAELARRLADLAPGELHYSFFCNSGTEAVEAALKLARAATGRVRILSTINAFHGKTLGALAASGRDVFKTPFGPMVPGFEHLPYGDAAALEAAMGEDVAAVILEPVQGEGGVWPAPPGYLAAAREACDRAGALLIFDEVQTGFGRCGRLFACELAGVAPDLMCLAKGMSGGVVPMGAVLGTVRAFQVFEQNAFMHSSTFGGNPLACAAALATLDVLEDEALCARAVELGDFLCAGLRSLQAQYPEAITDVRGLGLLIGVEFADADVGAQVIGGMAARRVIAAYTLNQPRVIRFEPPLVITREQCEHALEVFHAALRDCLGRG